MSIAAADLLVNVRADVDDARRKIRDLDNDLDRLGGTMGAVGGLARGFGLAVTAGFGVLASSAVIGGVSQFIGALLPLGGLLAALPGVALVAGAAFGVLKLGLSGFGDAIKALMDGDPEALAEAMKGLAPAAQAVIGALQGLGPGFTALKLDVQERLFSGLAESVAHLGTLYMGALSPAIGVIADRWNEAAKAVAGFLGESSTVASIVSIFESTGEAMRPLGQILRDLLAGFLDFGVVGASLMPEFTAWIGKGAAAFREWAAEARASGDIERWIRDGADAAQNLGGVLLNLGQIIKGVFSAYPGVDGFLGSLKQSTQAVEDFVNSAEGQTALASFFASTQEALRAIGPVLAAAVRLIGEGLAPVLANLATGIGPGLTTFLLAVKDAFVDMAPAATILGEAVGSLLAWLAPMVAPLGQIVTELVTRLAPVLPALIAGFLAFAAAVKGAMILSALGPALALIATPAGAIVLALAGIAGGFIYAYRESETFRDIVNGVVGAVVTKAQEFAAYFMETLWPGIQGAWDQIVAAFSTGGGEAGATMDRFRGLLDVVVGAVRAFGEAIQVAFQVAVAVITYLWDTFGQTLITGLRDMVNALITIFTGLFQVVTGIWKTFSGLFTGDWGKMWDGIKMIFTGFGTAFMGLLELFLSRIMLAMGLAWDGIKALVSAGWDAVKAVTMAVVGAVVEYVAGIPGEMAAGLAPLGQAISGVATAAWNAFTGAVTSAFGATMSYVRGIPGEITQGLGPLGSLLKSAGADLLRGLASGITGAIGGVIDAAKAAARAAVNAVKGALGIASPSKVMIEIGKWTGEGLEDGLRAMAGQVRAAGADLASAAIPNVTPGQGLTPAGAGLTGAPSAGAGAVTVAAGAVQVTIQGNVTEDAMPQVRSSVDEGFRLLLAEIKGGRVPGAVGSR